MHEIINYIVQLVSDLGYTWILIMMILESSFFPFPSEVAMVPAWYLASTWEMNFWFALLVWTTWALIWATINYLLWFYLGRKIITNLIHKYWKYFFIKDEHYKKSEDYFLKHGSITTFLARFITVIRQLISLPAWVFEMNFAKFFFYTGLWAWLWNLFLMIFGYIMWKNIETLKEYSLEILWSTFLLVFIIWLIYYYINKKKTK